MYFCKTNSLKLVKRGCRFGALVLMTLVSAKVSALTITGKIQNAPAKSKVYLYSYFGNELEKLDSTGFSSNTFQIKLKTVTTGLYRVGFDKDNAFDVVLSGQNVTIEADMKTQPVLAKYTGTKENEVLASYLKSNASFLDFYKNLDKKAAALQQSKDQAKAEVEAQALNKSLDSAFAALQKGYFKLAAVNKGTFMAKFLNSLAIGDSSNANNYFLASDFTDESLVKSPLIPRKTEVYLVRFTQPMVPEFQASADKLLAMAPAKSDGKLVLYKSLIDIFDKYALEYAGPMSKQMKDEFVGSPRVNKYVAAMPKRGVDIGDEAPEIALADTNGTPVNLSSLKGKVVLLDFWASWCRPCRMENPNVVRLYKAYKDNGFTVYSVSLDNSKDQWKGAIRKDQLTWSHVSDLQGWSSSAAKTYKVTSIPHTFLIDADGKIVAKNLRGEDLEKALQQLFIKKE